VLAATCLAYPTAMAAPTAAPLTEEVQDLSQIDHILLGTPDLDTGIAFAKALFGVQPEMGGSHPDGTRNALLSLADKTFLEILAPDPAQGRCPGMAEALRQLPSPALLTWATRSNDDLVTAATRAAAEGLVPIGPAHSSRTSANGNVLNFDLLFLAGHPYGAIVPFLIDWDPTAPHTGATAPRAGTLADFTVRTPDADPVSALLRNMQIPAQVLVDTAPSLAARVVLPDGRSVVLRSSEATMAIRTHFYDPSTPCQR
jgi:hypothetical protein